MQFDNAKNIFSEYMKQFWGAKIVLRAQKAVCWKEFLEFETSFGELNGNTSRSQLTFSSALRA